MLAASGERGRSRDQLLGLFWPEVSQSRARHSLDQLLYAIRTSLDGAAFAGANPLRLNPAIISSDVGDFAKAIELGDTESAVGHYGGSFLEGFYLSDAPEFEQWMEAERGRIERSYTEAVERLAKNAEDAPDFAAAARWRQKLSDADPVSSKHAIGLIRALMNVGDHAAALRHAERYEAIVAQELGTSVGPAVATLVAEVRARAMTGSVVVRGDTTVPRINPDISSKRPAPVAAIPLPGDIPIDSHVPSPPEQVTQAMPDASALATSGVNDSAAAAPRVESHSGSRRRTVAMAAFASFSLAALLGYGVWTRQRVVDRPVAAAVPASIAVLPLANLSGDARDAALVDGLTEELIGVLARIERLRVVARTSAFMFRNTNMDVRHIADSLQVSHIVEGGVQRAGQRIRVQLRLVDARDGSTRWSETYDRELSEIFQVQSEIAAAVAHQLDLRLGGRAVAAVRRGTTKNIAAYELYLRGNNPVLLRNDTSILRALEYFRQAIALDSTFALAYTGFARMHLTSISRRNARTSPREMHAISKVAALKALSLDDSLAEAHATVGMMLAREYDIAAAEKALRRAVSFDPASSRTREWVARLHHWMQRRNDALAEANRAVENDPLSPSAHAEVAYALCAGGHYAQGLARLQQISAITPPLGRTPLYTGLCHAMNQDWPRTIVALRQSQYGEPRAFLGYAFARGGRRKDALAILGELEASSASTNSGAFPVAIVYAGLGDHDRAFEWLDRSIDDLSLTHYVMLPLFDDLHADPRFQDIRRQLRLQKR